MQDPVLQVLVESAAQPIGEREEAAVGLVLADALACAASSMRLQPHLADQRDLAGLVAAISLRDLDDVDWHTLHHPGAVVIGTSLMTAAEVGADGRRIATSIASGYRVAATLGEILDPSYRQRWHATAICGAVGSAVAASLLLQPDGESCSGALTLAALSAGGLAQAPLARNGAAVFTRMAAASLGALAARSAFKGMPVAAEPFSGKGGLIDVLTERNPHQSSGKAGVLTTSLRLFPCTGFGHAAVWAARRVQSIDGPYSAIEVDVSGASAAMTKTGGWWDVLEAVRQTVVSGDPFSCDGTEKDPLPLSLEPCSLPVTKARLHVLLTNGSVELLEEEVPGAVSDPQTPHLWEQKCLRVLGIDPISALDNAAAVVDQGVDRGLDVHQVLPKPLAD